jgi:thioesterase domain-containing protein
MEQIDWRSTPPPERDRRLETWIREEKDRNVDLTQAPVDRLALIRLTDEQHEFIWSCHHILLDGWSSAILLSEVFEAYDALRKGSSVPEGSETPFKDYVSWLNAQDKSGPEQFWRDYLSAVEGTSALSTRQTEPGSSQILESSTVVVESVSSQAVAQWARKRRVTANCLFQGCWALLLAERTKSMKPVFGITVSGRGAPMKGIESMVGMFANTLPIVLEVDPAAESDPWFKDVFKRQMEIQRYEHCPLGRILDWGGVTLRQPLFDSLLVFANFPFSGHSSQSDAGAIELVNFQGDVTSSFPLTVLIRPGKALEIEARYDTRRFTSNEAAAILDRFRNLIEEAMSDQLEKVGALLSNEAESAAPVSAPMNPDSKDREPFASKTEEHLAQVWDDLLGFRSIGRSDNLFSAGGHSLAIPRLISRIHNDFGIELEIGKVFDSPTIRGLAAELDPDDQSPEWKTLVPIRESGRKPPFVLVHHLRPGLGYVYDLASVLGSEHPVFGLQAACGTSDTVHAMATRYLGEVTERLPRGPIRFGGLGFGGCLAYEMACQMAEAGRSPDQLILIDSPTPEVAFGNPPRSMTKMLRRLRGVGRSSASEPASDSEREKASELTDLEQMPEIERELVSHHLELWKKFLPRPFGGDVRLLQSDRIDIPRGLGWKKYIGGKLRTEILPDQHGANLKDPHLRTLAQTISA